MFFNDLSLPRISLALSRFVSYRCAEWYGKWYLLDGPHREAYKKAG